MTTYHTKTVVEIVAINAESAVVSYTAFCEECDRGAERKFIELMVGDQLAINYTLETNENKS